MTEPTDDVVERALDMLSVIEYAQHRRCSPAYPDSSVHSVIASLVAEVERLRTDLARMTEQAEASILELRDVTRELDAVHGDLAEARAEVDRLKAAILGIDGIACGIAGAEDEPHPADVVERVRLLAAERDDFGDDYATASIECEEARRLLGRDVQEILTEVDAMRGRLKKRIDDLGKSVESYRVQAFGKEAAERSLAEARAVIDRVRALHSQGACSCGHEHVRLHIGTDCDPMCNECGPGEWPCATRRTLAGEVPGE